MSKVIKRFMQFVEGVITVMFGIAVLLVVAQIFWRYALGNPITWTNQIVRALFCWMTYLGIPCLFNRNILMSFDLLHGAMHGVAHVAVSIAFRVIGLFFCVCWFIFSFELCQKSVGLVFPGIAIPKNALYCAQNVCCALLFLVQVSQIIELIGKMKRGGEEIEK